MTLTTRFVKAAITPWFDRAEKLRSEVPSRVAAGIGIRQDIPFDVGTGKERADRI
jgi:hypothetical protein